jgi:hypothetical protein
MIVRFFPAARRAHPSHVPLGLTAVHVTCTVTRLNQLVYSYALPPPRSYLEFYSR